MSVTYRLSSLMTVKEVSDLFQVHRTSVWRWIQNIKKGKQIRVANASIPITRVYQGDDGTHYFLRDEIQAVFDTWVQPTGVDIRTAQAMFIEELETKKSLANDEDEPIDSEGLATDDELDDYCATEGSVDVAG